MITWTGRRLCNDGMLISADICLLCKIILCLRTNLCFHEVLHWIPFIFPCLLPYVQSVWGLREYAIDGLPALTAYYFIIHIKWPEIFKCVVMWQIIDLGCKYWRAQGTEWGHGRGKEGSGRIEKPLRETPERQAHSQAGICKWYLPQHKQMW